MRILKYTVFTVIFNHGIIAFVSKNTCQIDTGSTIKEISNGVYVMGTPTNPDETMQRQSPDGLSVRILSKTTAVTLLQYINSKKDKPLNHLKYALAS